MEEKPIDPTVVFTYHLPYHEKEVLLHLYSKTLYDSLLDVIKACEHMSTHESDLSAKEFAQNLLSSLASIDWDKLP